MSEELLKLWGTNIAGWREERGLSMQQLADEVGVRMPTVWRWEAGKMAPTDEHKIDLAAVLDVDVRSLFPLVRSQVA